MACVNHPDRTNTTFCNGCGAEICPDCAVDLGGRILCFACKEKEVRDFERGEAGAGDKERTLSPWENRRKIGFWEGLTQTMKMTLFSPGKFFSSIPTSGGAGAPLLYAIIIATPFAILSLLIDYAIQGEKSTFGVLEVEAAVATVVLIVLFPIIMFIAIYISAAIMHLGLMIVGGNKKGFEATLRTVCYCSSTSVFGIIPLIGGFIGGIWNIVIAIIGISEMHGVSKGKAAFAVLFGLILLICCVALIVASLIPVLVQQAG